MTLHFLELFDKRRCRQLHIDKRSKSRCFRSQHRRCLLSVHSVPIECSSVRLPDRQPSLLKGFWQFLAKIYRDTALKMRIIFSGRNCVYLSRHRLWNCSCRGPLSRGERHSWIYSCWQRLPNFYWHLNGSSIWKLLYASREYQAGCDVSKKPSNSSDTQ